MNIKQGVALGSWFSGSGGHVDFCQQEVSQPVVLLRPGTNHVVWGGAGEWTAYVHVSGSSRTQALSLLHPTVPSLSVASGYLWSFFQKLLLGFPPES